MKERNLTCLREEWEQLPTDQLDEILQAELRKEHPDEEVVLPILKILEKREKNYPVEITEQISTAWGKYSERNSTPKRPSRKRAWVLSAAAVAAVVCIVMAIPRTVGAESIFDVLFRWTNSVFEFFDPERDATNPPVEYVFQTDNPGLQQLYDKVNELGVTEQVVPMWLPEGLELQELKETHTTERDKLWALFNNGDVTATMTYWITANKAPMQYEKEDETVEFFESDGTTYFIMENEGKIAVAWSISGVECLLNIDAEKEAVYEIIQSIHRRNIR